MYKRIKLYQWHSSWLVADDWTDHILVAESIIQFIKHYKRLINIMLSFHHLQINKEFRWSQRWTWMENNTINTKHVTTKKIPWISISHTISGAPNTHYSQTLTNNTAARWLMKRNYFLRRLLKKRWLKMLENISSLSDKSASSIYFNSGNSHSRA